MKEIWTVPAYPLIKPSKKAGYFLGGWAFSKILERWDEQFGSFPSPTFRIYFLKTRFLKKYKDFNLAKKVNNFVQHTFWV